MFPSPPLHQIVCLKANRPASMDFSSLINKEIAKKKQEVEGSSAGDKKYLRRGDAERERERKYREEQERIERERQEKLKRERDQEEQEREERRLKREKRSKASSETTKEANAPEAPEEEDLPDLDKQEVKSKLRELDEPVTIFGESDNDRIKRLLNAEKKQQKRKHIEEETKLLEGPIEDLKIIPESVRDDQKQVNLQIRAYLKYLVAKWEVVLTERSEEAGDQAFDMLRQTNESIGILLKKLRKNTLHEDLFVSLATLTMYLQQKEFRQANDTYIKMSIGNAAWPIGVTAVGIHARAAQERITGKEQVANVMKSEDTRRWLTAVKRLVTFSEGNDIGLYVG